jgi:beta-1,4-mannosyltransferase
VRLRQRTAESGPGVLTSSAVAALKALEANGHDPILLGYHPVVHTNPYLGLLYQRAWEEGIAPLPIPTVGAFDELAALAGLGHKVVLHLHWLNEPLRGAATPADARHAGQEFLERLDGIHAAGGRLVWTVHNILPHGATHENEERWFRGAVAGRADVIHVMAGSTPEIVAPYFELPRDKVLHVPHPNYIGAYADVVTRDQARHDLGLAPDELVYLVLGSIRSYKGIWELLDAWEQTAMDGIPRRLVIAGGPAREPGVRELVDRASTMPDVLIHPERVEPDRMQLFLRGADVAVLPYVRSLNSGALMLALSFGLPAIAPAGGGLAEVLDERAGCTFEPGDRGGLPDALRTARELATPDAQEAAIAIARRYNAADLSRQLARGLRARLGWEDAGRSQLPGPPSGD